MVAIVPIVYPEKTGACQTSAYLLPHQETVTVLILFIGIAGPSCNWLLALGSDTGLVIKEIDIFS